MEAREIITELARLGNLLAIPIMPNEGPWIGTPYTLRSNDMTLEDLERLLPTPNRKRCNAVFGDTESFIRYVAEQKLSETRIFEDRVSKRLVAIIDFHQPGAGKAGWCQHRASLLTVHSDEFLSWESKSNNWLPQSTFAEHIEENLKDILNPPSAEMLEIAQTLEAKRNVQFKKAIRLDKSDTELHFTETSEAKAGQNGTLVVPTEFVVWIPIFGNEDEISIRCRLRYDIGDGNLKFRYQMLGIKEEIQTAWKVIADKVATETKIATFVGNYL